MIQSCCYRQTISPEEVNKLPLKAYRGPVEVIASEAHLTSVLPHLQRERILGFDIETRPAFKRGESYPPSLLQLASGSVVYLFQLQYLSFPSGLNEILSDPAIAKVGVALDFDMKKINEISTFIGENLIELGGIATRLGIKNTGLRSLAANFLGFRISKKTKCSNWSRKVLSPEQITYAATDAWVSREIYLCLEKLGVIQL